MEIYRILFTCNPVCGAQLIHTTCQYISQTMISHSAHHWAAMYILLSAPFKRTHCNVTCMNAFIYDEPIIHMEIE